MSETPKTAEQIQNLYEDLCNEMPEFWEPHIRAMRDLALASPAERDATIAELREQLAAARVNEAIGQLVREKLVSGNAIPVERCTITAVEVAALAEAK